MTAGDIDVPAVVYSGLALAVCCALFAVVGLFTRPLSFSTACWTVMTLGMLLATAAVISAGSAPPPGIPDSIAKLIGHHRHSATRIVEAGLGIFLLAAVVQAIVGLSRRGGRQSPYNQEAIIRQMKQK